MFPFENFFHPGKQKKVAWGKIRWIGRAGTGGPAVLVKNCWSLSTMWVGVLVNDPSWNGGTSWKSLQKKNSLKPNAASYNNTICYTDKDGFLKHSPSRGSLYYKEPTLQKIIMGFFGGWEGPHSQQKEKKEEKKKEKFFSPWNETRWIYSLNFSTYPTVVVTIASLALTSLTSGSLYVLTTFLQLPLLSPSTSGNHQVWGFCCYCCLHGIMQYLSFSDSYFWSIS